MRYSLSYTYSAFLTLATADDRNFLGLTINVVREESATQAHQNPYVMCHAAHVAHNRYLMPIPSLLSLPLHILLEF